MNCEKCQDLLSDFLDGALDTDDSRMLNAHLEECLSCLGARDDLNSILSACHGCRGEYDAPPNERALWLRIRNIIESEQQGAATTAVAATHVLPGSQGENWWSRLMSRTWELSLPQLTGAVAAIVIAVSLATVFGVQRMQNLNTQSVRPNELVSNSPQSSASSTTMLTVDDRVRHQQMEIDYWNKRIQQQMARWSPQMRESFERNLTVIDQAVADSRNQLVVNPHDEVSEEMLNSALNEKMQLLREFSDL